MSFNSILKTIILLSLSDVKNNQLLHDYNHDIGTECKHRHLLLMEKTVIKNKFLMSTVRMSVIVPQWVGFEG